MPPLQQPNPPTGRKEPGVRHPLRFDAAVAAAYDDGMKTLSITFPDALADRLEQYVREGWVADPEQAVVEALRRFLDSHRPELIEGQVGRTDGKTTPVDGA